MRQPVRRSAQFVAVALLVASAATAQVRTQTSSGEVSRMTAFDSSAYANLTEKHITFLMIIGDSLEISIGTLARTKGTDQRVKDYGATLATDHTAHLAKTWEMITDEKVGVEAIANDNEGKRLRETFEWLQSNPASPAWDANLLRFQVQHHQHVIDILNRNVKAAHDDDLEAHVAKSLTSLANHRDAAKSIATALGVMIP